MSAGVQLCIPVVAFHIYGMCVCVRLCSLYWLHIVSSGMPGQMEMLEQLAQSFGTSLTPSRRVCYNSCATGRAKKAFHHVTLRKQITSQSSRPTPQLRDIMPPEVPSSVREMQLLYGGKGGPEWHIPASESNHEACGKGMLGTHSAFVFNALNQAHKCALHVI